MMLLLIAPGTPDANAGTGLRYTVVDADQARDGGVFYRNSPRWSDTSRTPGIGGYYGETVELVCGAWGDAVGPYANRRWHLVDNLTRPDAGRGWLPDRYLSTPNAANQPTPGEPECGAAPPAHAPPAPGGGSVYYQPRSSPGDPVAPASTLTLPVDQWAPGGCSSALGGNFPGVVNGKRVTTLGGWSLGRLGPIYLLASDPARAADQIDDIILFDPGSLANYSNECDRRYPQSTLLADWLSADPNHHLLILAGKDTADYGHPVNGYAHAGIQNTLFPAIRGKAIARQVLVCNYDAMDHPTVMRSFAGLLTGGSRTTCPGSPDDAWYP